jgi:hypothetical protein
MTFQQISRRNVLPTLKTKDQSLTSGAPTQERKQSSKKGKGQSDFSDWPLFMPATTYAPTHLARAVPSALRGLTSVFGMGTGGSPAVRSPTSRSCQLSAVSSQPVAGADDLC